MRRVCVFELYVRFENGRRSHHIAIADLAVHNGNDRACVCMCLECLCYEILLCVRFLRLLGCFYFCCFAYFFYISLSFSPSLRPPLAYFPSNNSLGWETVLEFFCSYIRSFISLRIYMFSLKGAWTRRAREFSFVSIVSIIFLAYTHTFVRFDSNLFQIH